MGGSSKQTIGYEYYMGIHMGVSRGPVNELVEIRVADRTAWRGSVTDDAIVPMDADELFGGQAGEGGVKGQLEVMMGRPSQPVNPRLQAMLGGLVPAFRGLFTLFFDGMVTAMNPYPKPWSMRVRRSTEGWDGGNTWYAAACRVEMADGDIHAMNPAHIIAQALTDPDWGLGNPMAMIGNSFNAAADALLDEGFGLCFRWVRQTDVEAFIDEINAHIGGNVYLHPRTGRWEITLTRNDYNPAELPLFDYESGLLDVAEESSSSPAEAVNEVIVMYRDPITNEDRQVRAQNLAGIQSAGAVRSQTLNFPGIPTAELALRVAQRELRVRSGGIRRFKLRMDHRGYELLPGDVFRIAVPDRNIGNMVLRVGAVRNGELRQGAIEFDALQDVFGLPATSFVGVQPPGYVPPQIEPQPIEQYRIIELNYRDALGIDGIRTPGDADLSAWVAALALRTNPLGRNFLLQTQTDGADEWTEGADGDYCPSAVLVNAMPVGEAPVTVDLAGGIDLDLVEQYTAALIDDEIFRVVLLDPDELTATLARGCIDTVPAPHDAGARVWFYGSGYAGVDPAEYVGFETVNARLRSRTSIATLPAEDATGGDITLAGRIGRPYPPGRVRINGEAYPAAARGVLKISWATRDKTTIQDQLVDASMGNAGAPEVTYNVRLVRVSDGLILDQKQGLTETFTELYSSVSGEVELRVESQALTYDTSTRSVQSVRIPFNYIAAGWGQAWGYAWGGTLDPGVVAPRGGVSGRELLIMIRAYDEDQGRYVGVWNDSDVSGNSWIVSSADGHSSWTRHALFDFGGRNFYRLAGQWLCVRTGAMWTAPSLDGPWVRAETPSASQSVVGLSFESLANGRLLMHGNGHLFSTTDGVTWETHETPPVLDESRAQRVHILSIRYASGGYVALAEEGEFQFGGPLSMVGARVWRSTDLVSWQLVTPQFLEDGEFSSGSFRGLWRGNQLEYIQGRFLLMVVLGSSTGGSVASDAQRAIFYSDDGQSWSRSTINGDPGNGRYGYTQVVEYDGQLWTIARSFADSHDGAPRMFSSSNGGGSWDVHFYDPINQLFPRRAGNLVGGDRLFLGDFDTPLIQSLDGETWQTVRLQRPTEEE